MERVEMQRAFTLGRSSIGLKAVMAVTGVVLFAFLIGHLLGNLQLFLGPEALHAYAASLRRIPAALWVVRLVLLASLVAHVVSAIKLVGRNADARKVAYQRPRVDQATSYAARTMRWTGPIVALYLVYHLLHLTLGYHPLFDHQNPYNNVVHGFLDWRIATVYVVANLLLGLHLFHGAWSFFQSIGLSHPRYDAYRKAFAIGVAGFLTVGNVGIPIAVLAGAVEPTTETFCAPELAVEPGECDLFE